MPAFSCKKFRSDRKSTRLNSSHTLISYAVSCLKKNYGMPKPTVRGAPTSTSEEEADAPPARRDGPHDPRGAQVWRTRPCEPPARLFFFKDQRPPGLCPLAPPGALPF